MKHFYKLIAFLLLFLFAFSLAFSTIAEEISSSNNQNTSQHTESTESTENESNNTPSTDTSSDNTSSDSTSSDSTSSDNTSSDNTSSENTSSDNTSSDNTSSDNTSSDSTSSDNPPTDQTPPDNTSSGEPSLPEDIYNPDALLGTKEEGIILSDGLSIWSIPIQSGLNNYNFSDGLKAWASINDKKPSEVISVVVDGENSYISSKKPEIIDGVPTISGTNGLMTPQFTCENIIPGQAAVVVFDWSGSKDFNIKLEQYDTLGLSLVSSGFGKTIYTAQNDQEWNTTATVPIHPVRISVDGYEKVVFILKIEIYNQEADIKIDNIRIGYSNSNGIIYDINGNEIVGEKRTSSSAEAPAVVFKPPTTNDSNTLTEAFERAGGNQDIVKIFVVLGTIALCVILALGPSAIVKASQKHKSKEIETDEGFFNIPE